MVHSTHNLLQASVLQYPDAHKDQFYPRWTDSWAEDESLVFSAAKMINFWASVQQPHFDVVHDTWRLYNQIDNMTLDKLSRGVYLEDVTGPVRLCHATNCGGLADIHSDTTRGGFVFFILGSLNTRSTHARQVFSQHMSLKTDVVAVRKRPSNLWLTQLSEALEI